MGSTSALVPGPLARLQELQLLTALSPQVGNDFKQEFETSFAACEATCSASALCLGFAFQSDKPTGVPTGAANSRGPGGPIGPLRTPTRTPWTLSI